MKDKIIEDWYGDRRNTRKAAPAPDKPKDQAADFAQLLAQEYIDAIQRIKAVGAAAEKNTMPRRGGAPVTGEVQPWEKQTKRQPDTPWLNLPKPAPMPLDPGGSRQIIPLPYYPQEGRSGIVPLPYYPEEDEPRAEQYSRDWRGVPSPEPGPPPTSDPEPSYTPKPSQAKSSNTGGMIDPGVLAAQEEIAKKQQIGATVFVDPGLVDAQKEYEKMLHRGFVDPGLAEAEKWDKTLHPEIYKEGDFVDLTPGDDNKDNPYGINIDEFLRWAYSQLGYIEKETSKELNSKTGNTGAYNNWTKYGKWFGELKENSDYDNAYWCAMFASWCAMKAGISDREIPKTASTSDFIGWYIGEDRFKDKKDATYNPSAGDMILYQSISLNYKGNFVEDAEYNPNSKYVYHGKSYRPLTKEQIIEIDAMNPDERPKRYELAGHTGIVIGYTEENSKRYVYTIEGNADNSRGVYFFRVSLDNDYLRGFGVNGGTSPGIIPNDYIIKTDY